MARDIRFELLATDPCGARRARFETTHGVVETPTFMPVGTQGTVKAVLPRDVEQIGSRVILANTYHLSLGERTDLVERRGGLHSFMAWPRSILTDSGGFQVFSLPGREVSEEGVSFPGGKGRPRLLLDPEASMDIQRRLGADIVMAFDECCAHDAAPRYVRASVDRTTRWAERCRRSTLAPHQFLFGIVQGGVHQNLRERSAAAIRDLDFDGYAIGGVSVGEGHELMCSITGWTAPLLPEDKPRYLMGVGLPEDILAAVERGMDMFDCVIPTRYARGGTLFTRKGPLRIGDKTHRHDTAAIDGKCGCYTCQHYDRMTLRHLHYCHEPVFDTLASIHNLQFYEDLLASCRHEIQRRRFGAWKAAFLRRYGATGTEVPEPGEDPDPRAAAGPGGQGGQGGRRAGGRASGAGKSSGAGKAPGTGKAPGSGGASRSPSRRRPKRS